MPAPAPKPPASPSLKFITPVKSDTDWEEQITQAASTTLCVVDVYAGWCGPTVALGKRITNLSSDYMDYDVKWVEACADALTKFKTEGGEPRTAKPLFILYKMGMEVGRMANGANGNELQRLIAANCGDKKAA